jgi:hypothetical protein
MCEFETLPEVDQAAIMAMALGRLASYPGCQTIDDLAALGEVTPHDLWADICSDAAAPECSIPVRLRPLRIVTHESNAGGGR